MDGRTGTGNHDTEASTKEVTADDYIWRQRHATLYRCALASRYHRARERYFDYWDRGVTAASLIGGSAAFSLAAQEDLVKWAGALVVIASAISLVFAFAEKARRHAALAERFKRVEAEIRRVGDFNYTDEQVNAWRASIAEIEAAEPPALRVLVSLCQNDIAMAEGQPDKAVPQSLWKRFWGHAFDVEPARKQEKPPEPTPNSNDKAAAA